MRKILTLIFTCFFKLLLAFSKNPTDTIVCKVLYNDYLGHGVSLRYDGGDQLYFTPEFFLLNNWQLTDTGFLYSDSISSRLLNDSNYLLQYSKKYQRLLNRHRHPGKNKYNGLHFYLFDVIFIVEKEVQIKSAEWLAPASKYGSVTKLSYTKKIIKIVKISPINITPYRKRLLKSA